MVEIRFHGRGGQGTVVLTILLAKAFFQAGWQVQSFPFFGSSGGGAGGGVSPARPDKDPGPDECHRAGPRGRQDQTLLASIDVTRGLKPGGWVLLNSATDPEDRGSTPASSSLAWTRAGSPSVTGSGAGPRPSSTRP
jgi:pyruvate ferredoxin oxidoreductase gamma subunit/2-oxoisovalerate ferredoxin oxidoreductase gamma subunit